MAKEIQEMNSLDAIQEKLTEFNSLGLPYKFAYVNPVKDCVMLEKNCHYMDKDTMDRLTHNIKEDGFLSQIPFCLKRDDGKYLVLSGNHRIESAIKGKLPYVMVQYVEHIDRDKQIGYQLSHNALVGKDDQQMLKDIYSQIKTIEGREFSGLNGLQFIDANKIPSVSINDGDIQLTEMKFLFVESRSNNVKAVLSELERMNLDETSSLVYGSYEEFIKVTTEIKKMFNIQSKTVAFSKMIDICKEYLENHKEDDK